MRMPLTLKRLRELRKIMDEAPQVPTEHIMKQIAESIVEAHKYAKSHIIGTRKETSNKPL